MSFENLYFWLKEQHARGDNHNLYDHATKRLLKRYKLPFKHMTIPPAPNNLFKFIKGARRLSEWISECQATLDERERPRTMGLPKGIIAQTPPELVAPPPLAAAAAARRQSAWDRVTARARARRRMPMRTAQEDSDDAELTRDVVEAVVAESNHATPAASTDSDDELERELEEALREGDEDVDGEPREGAGLTLEQIRDQLMRD